MTPFAQRITDEAERQRARTLARTLWLQTHLAEFLQESAKAGLHVIVLKGAALSETVYPKLGLRDFRDIDILVHPSDSGLAKKVLEQIGYTTHPFHWDDMVHGRDGQADFACHTAAGAVVLELHTDFFNNDLLRDQTGWEEDRLWERAQQRLLAGIPALVLGPEDQLLHLCLHLAGHYFSAPRSLWDIARVCAVSAVEWPLLIHLARQTRMERIAFVGLWLAAELMDADVPDAVLSQLAPPRPALLLQIALTCAHTRSRFQAFLLRLPLLWLLCDRPARFLQIALRLLFPSRRWWHDHRFLPKKDKGFRPFH